jgi:hypothetical protein
MLHCSMIGSRGHRAAPAKGQGTCHGNRKVGLPWRTHARPKTIVGMASHARKAGRQIGRMKIDRGDARSLEYRPCLNNAREANEPFAC